MEKYKMGFYFLILIVGAVSLYIGWNIASSHNAIFAMIGASLALSNMILKISLAKKGYKHIIATIGSYMSVIALVFCAIEIFLG